MLLMGHRGWSTKYPENTILAFRKSLELVSFYEDIGIIAGAWCVDDVPTLEKCLSIKGLSIVTSNAPDIVKAHVKERAAK